MSDTPARNDPAASNGALLPGTLIAGRYEIQSHLGQGGMGTVYAAQDRLVDQAVALKFVRPSVAKSERMTEALRQEVRLSQVVTHRNVARTYTLAESEGRLFVVMELLRGVRLAELIREGRLAPLLAVDIARQVLLGLSSAHERGVVHRDIKPQNITLCNDGRAVLMDFGIARVLGASSVHDAGVPSGVRQTSFGGTPGYVPPEAFRGEAVGPAADLYGVGLVLFEMLTGVAPFIADDPLELMMLHVDQVPPRADAGVEDIPTGVGDVVAKLLAKRPEERFASANEAARALAVYVPSRSDAPLPPRSGPAAKAATVPPPARRRPPWLGVAIALGVALGAFLIWMSLGGSSDGNAVQVRPRPSLSAAPPQLAQPVVPPSADTSVVPPSLPTAATPAVKPAKRVVAARRNPAPSVAGRTVSATQAEDHNVAPVAAERRRRLLELEE